MSDSTSSTMKLHQILVIFYIHSLLFEVRTNEEDVERLFTCALQCIEALQNENSGNIRQERLYRELDDHTRTVSKDSQ